MKLASATIFSYSIAEPDFDRWARNCNASQTTKLVNAHILVSPIHRDHIQGIPFLRSSLRQAGKFFLVSFLQPHSRTLKRVMEEQMAAPYFPVDMSEMKSQRGLLQHGTRKSL